MIDFESQLTGKKIFLTGHTGFTGAWTCFWLNTIGADVYGYSLPPSGEGNLFEELGLNSLVNGEYADIRDFSNLSKAMSSFRPDLVLHLAAQPLVSEGYKNPRETFEINCQGTANVLEALHALGTDSSALCITTDKVYRNDDLGRAFVETDQLGGKDPYSASKAAAEITIESYRKIFQSTADNVTNIAVARGGNIVGGGDWAANRLIPDLVRAYKGGSPLFLRNSNATRPWQHVLSLVTGYLNLLAGLLGDRAHEFNQAFNLGPHETALRVGEVIEQLLPYFESVEVENSRDLFSESQLLELDSSLAKEVFGWDQVWSQKETLSRTAIWYREFLDGNKSASELCRDDLETWRAALLSTG